MLAGYPMFNRSDVGVVLVIDDNLNNLKMMVDTLKGHNFTVLIAQSGEAGYQRACFAQPDLILLDVLLPDQDGFETCRRLKQDVNTKEIPVIFMTALSDVTEKVKGFALGAVDYITKPFQAVEVVARVQTHINLRRLTILEERRRLTRALHDSVTQSLYSLTLLAHGWGMKAQRGQFDVTQATDAFAQLDQVAKQALREMRLIIHQLQQEALISDGLVEALEQRLEMVERRAQINATVTSQGDFTQLRPKVAEQLYFIAQEALNNALHHARAQSVTVTLVNESKTLSLSIRDDGIGFTPATVKAGLGLHSMQERTALIGGRLTIDSAPKQGTTVTLTVDSN